MGFMAKRLDRGDSVPDAIPLSVFERYMFADDSPAYPMTITVDATVEGLTARELFAEALRRTLARHTLLQSTVDDSQPARPCWQYRPDLPVPVDWAGSTVPLNSPAPAWIDLRTEPAVRIQVRASETAARLVLQIHHAAVDGMGTVAFLADLLACCRSLDAAAMPGGNLSPACDETATPRNSSHLALRERFYPQGRELFCRLGMLPGSIWTGLKFRHLPPVPLGLPRQLECLPPAEPLASVFTEILTEDSTAALILRARRQGGTVNDVLLCELFQLMAEHVPGAGPRDRLRIGMPCNLRDERDAQLPAANKVAISFLDRARGACYQPEDLLASIQRETRRIRRNGRGLQLLEMLRLTAFFRRRQPLQVPGGDCGATAVLSNLGQIDHLLGPAGAGGPGENPPADGPQLRSLTIVPNGRRGTAVVFFALTFRGRLRLTLWFDQRVLSPVAAARLHREYVARVQRCAVPLEP